jgi:hypothetical protein
MCESAPAELSHAVTTCRASSLTRLQQDRPLIAIAFALDLPYVAW